MSWKSFLLKNKSPYALSYLLGLSADSVDQVLAQYSLPDPRAGEETLGHIADNQARACLATNLATKGKKIRTFGEGWVFHQLWEIIPAAVGP